MTLYAKINLENIVENIIVADDDFVKTLSSTYVKVDETTRHAVIGSFYNKSLNKFIDPKPYPSWELNELSEWQSPIGSKPTDGNYSWNEEELTWNKLDLIDIELPINLS